MNRILIVGNANSGKTTLFNSITKSNEHVGNWHGVTVDEKSKNIRYMGNEFCIVDLPGIYSLNAFSLEEQISIDNILNTNDKILYLLDANNFRRGLFLAINLLLKNKNIKILINNYSLFSKNGGRIDVGILAHELGCEVEIIDAKKFKPTGSFFNFQTTPTTPINILQNKLERVEDFEDKDKRELEIELIYEYIFNLSKNSVKKTNKIYGYEKTDKYLLKNIIFFPLFLFLMFFIIYFTFFLVGPILSDYFLLLIDLVVKKPIMAIIKLGIKSSFVINLFEEGVFGACLAVLSFLPQICLMYLFLSMLENSGVISRMAFLLDDFLERIGLNGKMVYTMLMGFGCSTTATLTTKNMPDKNSKIKASILTPLMSCSAKLPIYTTVALAVCGVRSVWIILGLYLLGILIALLLACVFEKTILSSEKNDFIIEFPSLVFPNLKSVCGAVKDSCKQFVVKVFGIIFSMSVIVWLLTNLNVKLQYVGDSSRSILYSFSSMIAWIFKPLNLANPNIICALLIGLIAKELILSSFAISNKVGLGELGASLLVVTNPVNFNFNSAVVFLVFTLLYFPCISNFGIMLKQIGTKYTLLSTVLELSLAYCVAWLVNSILTKNISSMLTCVLVAVLVAFAIINLAKKIKNKDLCNDCTNCTRCK